MSAFRQLTQTEAQTRWGGGDAIASGSLRCPPRTTVDLPAVRMLRSPQSRRQHCLATSPSFQCCCPRCATDSSQLGAMDIQVSAYEVEKAMNGGNHDRR